MEYDDYDERMRQEIAEQILEAVEGLALMTQREFIATREELRGEMRVMGEDIKKELCTEFRQEIQSVRSELRSEFHAEIQEFRNEIQAGFKALYIKLHEEIEDLRTEMRAGFAAINGILTNHEYRLERIEKKLDIS